MQKIPDEGAWFALTYRGTDPIPVGAIERYGQAPHVTGSAIYALATTEDFSALHQLQTDEIWHYYSGDPLELLLLHPDGHGEVVVLGPEVLKGQSPQFTVKRGVWQGARPINASKDSYTLFGCTLAPGFEYGDFTMGYRDALQKSYPQFATQIAALTRPAFERAPAAVSATALASARAQVFDASDVKMIEVAPGIELRELIGRAAHSKGSEYSVATFKLRAGTGMPNSYNKVAREVLLVTAGKGVATLAGKEHEVHAGSVVMIEPQVEHSIRANASSEISFYAVSVPAFSPDDYVIAQH
jgi:predicted cupin superfamily sugar epimerase/quercetin dioxygenase-like cupin family protein